MLPSSGSLANMNSALVGFSVGGVQKLMRLHEQRSVEAVLRLVLDYLRGVSDAQLQDYAHRVRLVDAKSCVAASDPDFSVACACAQHGGDPNMAVQSWAELFECFKALEPWSRGLPVMPSARLETCADVHWAVVLDVDAMALEIFDNRNARYPWAAVGSAEPPLCRVALEHARDLSDLDLGVIQRLLQQHVVCDGEQCSLPASDAVSPIAHFAGPWSARVSVQGGAVRLELARENVRVVLNRVGELSLASAGVAGALRQAIEPTVLALGLGIYGEDLSVRQLAQIAAVRHQLPYDASERGLPLLDLGLRVSNGLGLGLGSTYFEDLRHFLIAHGLTLQGWRFLIKQEQPVQRYVLKFFPPSRRIMAGFTTFINLLAQAMQTEPMQMRRCPAALGGIERILDKTRGRPDPVREENARIFLRALMRARLDASEERNLDHETQDVSDFVYACPLVLKGVSWKSLCRRSDDWHRSLLIEVDPASDVRWPALLPHLTLGSYEAVELDCGYLLAQEGLEQRHCIGTYVNACSSGASRIFSLRREGKRVATVELQRRHGVDWAVVQIRGKANSPVTDAAALAAAHSVASAYAERSRRQALALDQATHPALRPGAYLTPTYLVHRQDHWTG